MNSTAQTYTAAQIAAALGRKRQNVARLLDGIPHSEAIAGGNVARAWAFLNLPMELRTALETEAVKRGCRNAEALLSNPSARWQPPIPIASVEAAWIDRASRLQSALATPLRRQHDQGMTRAGLEEIGLRDYQAAFGNSITSRHWSNLFRRTLDRDGGAQDWSRLDIYLDEQAFRATKPEPLTSSALVDFEPIRARVAGFKNPADLQPLERFLVWGDAVEAWARLADGGLDTKASKERLFDFLMSAAPGLAKTRDGMRKTFQRKWQEWNEAGRNPAAFRDGRAANGGRNKFPLPAALREKLIAEAALNHEGHLIPALRGMMARGELPAMGYARKSHIPHSVRQECGSMPKLVHDLHRGPRTSAANYTLPRDWSGTFSKDWWQGDDVTLEVYFYIPDGQGWYDLIRGQFLHMIDVRSRRIMNHVLIPERGYKAVHIRQLMNATCREHGLPRKGFAFEKGLWHKSHVVTGGPGEVSADLTEAGFKSLGLEFRHSHTPYAKVIENVNKQFQAQLKGELGWVGSNEMTDPMERVRRKMQEMKSGKLEPAGHFYSMAEWASRLAAHVERYNSTPQEGHLGGLSPNDAFEAFDDKSDPTTRLTPEYEYLFASHCKRMKIGAGRVTIRESKSTHVYASSELSDRSGQEAMVWRTPGQNDCITITDLNHRNPITVSRFDPTPATTATDEQMEARSRAQNAMASRPREIYRTHATKPQRFRGIVHDDPDAQALGQVMEKQREQLQAKKREENGLARKAQRLAGLTGFDQRIIGRDTETAEQADELARLQAKLAKGQSADYELP